MREKKSDKVVLITGARGGIGSVTAELLHDKGYRVYGTTRNLDNAPKTPYNFIQLNVNDDTSVNECIKEIMAKEGRIDVLINNAGYSFCGALKDTSTEELKLQFETNFFGVHRMIREIVPIMIKQNEGRIINIGTFGSRIGLPFQGAYSSSKAALANYTGALKVELLRDNLKVALIELDDTQTDFHSGRQFVQDYDQDPDAKRAVEIMYKSEQSGMPPKKIAKTVFKVLKKRNPKTRYTKGPEAFFFGLLLRIVSFRLYVPIVRLYYKVPKKRKE